MLKDRTGIELSLEIGIVGPNYSGTEVPDRKVPTIPVEVYVLAFEDAILQV
jgi:hypothetical protein